MLKPYAHLSCFKMISLLFIFSNVWFTYKYFTFINERHCEILVIGKNMLNRPHLRSCGLGYASETKTTEAWIQ